MIMKSIFRRRTFIRTKCNIINNYPRHTDIQEDGPWYIIVQSPYTTMESKKKCDLETHCLVQPSVINPHALSSCNITPPTLIFNPTIEILDLNLFITGNLVVKNQIKGFCGNPQRYLLWADEPLSQLPSLLAAEPLIKH